MCFVKCEMAKQLQKLRETEMDHEGRLKYLAVTTFPTPMWHLTVCGTVDVKRHMMIYTTSVTLCTVPVAIIMLPFLSGLHLLLCYMNLGPMKSLACEWGCVWRVANLKRWCHQLLSDVASFAFLWTKTADKLIWHCEVLLVGRSTERATLWCEGDVPDWHH